MVETRTCELGATLVPSTTTLGFLYDNNGDLQNITWDGITQAIQRLATGWTVRGSNPGGGEIFPTCPEGPWVHPASCTMGTGSFPGVKSGLVVRLTPHPLLVPLVMKEQSCTSTPPMGRTACTEPQCLYKGAHYLYLYKIYYFR